MAFTKITAAGIGSTETVTLDGLSVINDGSFGGNLTVSGVLTYEDVTNVDSVGVITARAGVLVGSGITLSKDGDIFATGVSTVTTLKVGSGVTISSDGDVFATGITTISENLKVGTGITISPDGDGFYTGVVTATSFSGDGSNLTGVSAGLSNIVEDTSPQLGGDLDTNSFEISLDDNHAVKFGNSNDMKIYHETNNSYILSDNFFINNLANSENIAKFAADGAVELYHDNTKQFETSANGLKFPSGKGIDFSATSDGSNVTSTTTMSNELLDDYEEGTWTPFFFAWIGSGVPATHDLQYGTYTKIGNTVHITFDLKGDRGNMGGNYITMGGLPFAHLGTRGGWGVAPWSEYVGSENSTSSTRGHGLEFGGGATVHAWLTGYTGGAAGSNYVATYMTTDYMSNTNHTRIRGFATYFTTA